MRSSTPSIVSLLLFLSMSLLLVSCSSEAALQSHPTPQPDSILEGDDLIIAIDRVANAAKLEDQRAIPELVEFSKHPDFLIRVQALKWLMTEHFRSQEAARKVFVDSLSDEHWLVRSFAVKALAKGGLTSEGREALEKRLPLEENTRVKGYIELALK